MRNMKIVAEPSANVLALASIGFAAAPLKVITNEKEIVDVAALDVKLRTCGGLCSCYAEEGGLLVDFEKF